jgi:DNA (cytosine-5)-methyltransferase 1
MLTLRGLDRVLGDLSEMGYDARWGVVGAYHVGAPHRRERIWILARRDKFLSYSQHNWIGWGEQQQESVKEKTGDDVANTKCFRPHPKENEQILGGTGSGQLCLEQPRNHRGNWWEVEPNMGRMADGVADRVDRLKAIGNGQVSVVAATAFRILKGK